MSDLTITINKKRLLSDPISGIRKSFPLSLVAGDPNHKKYFTKKFLFQFLILIKLHKNKFKKAILYDKCNNNNVKYEGTNMMSKVKAPFYSYKNPIIYYQNLSSNFFGNLYLGNETS